jgi:hypothetical protein
MLLVDVAGVVLQPKTVEMIPDWRKADLIGLSNELDEQDWVSELGNLDTEGSWTRYKNIVNNLQEKYVPKRIRRSKNKPIWMSQNTLRIIRKKRRLWKVYTESKDYA